MVILGLGCNLGNRLKQLRQALYYLQQVPHFSIQQVSPLYLSDALLPENAPDDWDAPYLNLALRCETTLKPYELLQHTKNIEVQVGRTPEKNWGPRVIDIDILAWDDLTLYDEVLHIPHEHLHERPFAFWPLADVAPRWQYLLQNSFHGMTAAEITARWGSRFSGEAPFHTKQIQQRIDTPELVGIINVTPDSFSEGKINAEKNAAAFLSTAAQLVEAGATIIDIGAEATGPNATPIDATIEWLRLEPVLTELIKQKSKMLITPKISVDTRNASVAEKALALGVDWINDVSGLDDKQMREVVKQHSCDVVFMHHLGIPVSKQQKTIPIKDDPVTYVFNWAQQRIENLVRDGIAIERLIFDIGIGFGKTAEQSFELIQRIDEFKKLGVRLLVGHSRKSFFNLFTTDPFSNRDIETNAVSHFLANHSIDFLRLHDVNACSRMFKVARAL